jgi:hypothetical protein
MKNRFRDGDVVHKASARKEVLRGEERGRRRFLTFRVHKTTCVGEMRRGDGSDG